ncbi:hypothetical protein Dimus_016477 [Dionaea muscipula]
MGSNGVGRWGDDSVDQDVDEVEKPPVQHSQVPICAESKEEKEGVYLAAVRKGLMDSEGPSHEGPRSMIGNRYWHNGLPLSYEQHVACKAPVRAKERVWMQKSVLGSQKLTGNMQGSEVSPVLDLQGVSVPGTGMEAVVGGEAAWLKVRGGRPR